MFDGRLSRSTLFATLVFAFALFGGILAVREDPALGTEMVAAFQEQVSGGFPSDSGVMLFLTILINNLVACIALFIGGATFGLLPLLVLAMNGLVIGGIFETIRPDRGIIFVLAALLPHGLLEIPSVILSAGLGLLLGEGLIRELVLNDVDVAGVAGGYGRFFVRIVVPLITAAAAVEAFITPHLLQLMS
ncbi:MAG: stage II sporulation protein M [Methanospirillum sp.]|nr:stage II sporulation protein M [Methanospirillum sp.]